MRSIIPTVYLARFNRRSVLYNNVQGCRNDHTKGDHMNSICKRFNCWAFSKKIAVRLSMMAAMTGLCCAAIGTVHADEIDYRLVLTPVGTGFSAKGICSEVFVSHIDPDIAMDEHIGPQVFPLRRIWKVDIDEEAKTVTVDISRRPTRYRQTAYYREGIGCTLMHDETTESLDAQLTEPETFSIPQDQYWPHGSAGVTPNVPGVDYDKLDAVLDAAMVDEGLYSGNPLGVAVIYKDKLIAERYGDSATAESPLQGWSMTKSMTGMLVGILSDRGQLFVGDPAPVPEWEGSEKAGITLENLLHMAAGLEWNEFPIGPNPDQGEMLFLNKDFPDYYQSRPVVASPGTVFEYSTGESSLLARIVQDHTGGTINSFLDFANDALLKPIHIDSAVFEFDTEGHPAGGAHLHMTIRDWARLGLLYAHKGNWFGNRIVSSDWIDYATTPSPANQSYGAQVWLNTGQGSWPNLPESSFAFRGFQSQNVIIAPEYDLIIVRMGVTVIATEDNYNEQALVDGVLESLSL